MPGTPNMAPSCHAAGRSIAMRSALGARPTIFPEDPNPAPNLARCCRGAGLSLAGCARREAAQSSRRHAHPQSTPRRRARKPAPYPVRPQERRVGACTNPNVQIPKRLGPSLPDVSSRRRCPNLSPARVFSPPPKGRPAQGSPGRFS